MIRLGISTFIEILKKNSILLRNSWQEPSGQFDFTDTVSHVNEEPTSHSKHCMGSDPREQQKIRKTNIQT